MKRTIVTAAMLALPFAACGFTSDPVLTPPTPAVVIRPASLILSVGATDTLLAFVTGVDATANRVMDWSAGDTATVQVTALSPPDHALVVGRKAGTTAVIARWHADPSVNASSTVMVR